jgi:hypothetical protein
MSQFEPEPESLPDYGLRWRSRAIADAFLGNERLPVRDLWMPRPPRWARLLPAGVIRAYYELQIRIDQHCGGRNKLAAEILNLSTPRGMERNTFEESCRTRTLDALSRYGTRELRRAASLLLAFFASLLGSFAAALITYGAALKVIPAGLLAFGAFLILEVVLTRAVYLYSGWRHSRRVLLAQNAITVAAGVWAATELTTAGTDPGWLTFALLGALLIAGALAIVHIIRSVAPRRKRADAAQNLDKDVMFGLLATLHSARVHRDKWGSAPFVENVGEWLSWIAWHIDYYLPQWLAPSDPSRQRALQADAHEIANGLRAQMDRLGRADGRQSLVAYLRSMIALVCVGGWLDMPRERGRDTPSAIPNARWHVTRSAIGAVAPLAAVVVAERAHLISGSAGAYAAVAALVWLVMCVMLWVDPEFERRLATFALLTAFWRRSKDPDEGPPRGA